MVMITMIAKRVLNIILMRRVSSYLDFMSY